MTRFDGADISHHQDDAGPIDWATLRQASASAWVATKATQGLRYVDPTMQAHRVQMAAQGFTHCGLYHWLSFNADPVLQADHFLDTVGRLHVGEFAMLDAEEGGITQPDCLTWCEAVEAETRRPVAVYTGAYVAGGTIWQNTELRTSIYGPRPMHLAAYTTEAKALALPGVKAYPWSAWQYSSDGPVPGVVGRCDMNRVDVREHFDIACGIADTDPQPEVDDMATMFFEVDGLPGQYMWTPGSKPIPFTNPADRDVILKGLEVDPANGGKISQEMYQRLFPSPAVDADALAKKIADQIVVPPLTGHLSADLGAAGHITGSVG